jgi:hypothetical protein
MSLGSRFHDRAFALTPYGTKVGSCVKMSSRRWPLLRGCCSVGSAGRRHASDRYSRSMPDADVWDVIDEELTAEAMAADPDVIVPDDAVPFGVSEAEGPLPEWYMPTPGPIRRTRPRVVAVTGLVLSLLIVNAAGLCVTYGWPEIAW